MPIKPRTLRLGTGALLSLATLLTRLPFRSRTLFEFDSVDFAVAVKRFSVEQVTPHVPGDILHVLGARFLALFTGSVLDAYVWQSILLSIGSVLFMWRAAAWLRGERVGLIAAAVWLTNPLFWFTGCTGTAYIHEAIYCTGLLYFGISWLREPNSLWGPVLTALTLALAIGARQNDAIFFTPAVLWLFTTLRPARKTTVLSLAVFILVCAGWLTDLVLESGGIATYLHAFAREHDLRSQSILFGNSWHNQLSATGKVLLLLPIMGGALTASIVPALLLWPKRAVAFIRESLASRVGRYALWLALPSLLFYLAIYFMKAGYLLTIVPVCVLSAACVIDMAAIWLAERVKRRSPDTLLLTRPLITRRAIVITTGFVALNVIWFTLPLNVVSDERMYDESTRSSFARGVESRLSTSNSIGSTIANRIFSTTNYHAIAATDRMNELTNDLLASRGANEPLSVVLATWWDRQAYRALPRAYVYDIQPMGDTIAVGLSHWLHRIDLDGHSIAVPPHARLFLLMRRDNPDFANLAAQMKLKRLPLPKYLDAYEVQSAPDTLHWRNAQFVLQ